MRLAARLVVVQAAVAAAVLLVLALLTFIGCATARHAAVPLSKCEVLCDRYHERGSMCAEGEGDARHVVCVGMPPLGSGWMFGTRATLTCTPDCDAAADAVRLGLPIGEVHR